MAGVLSVLSLVVLFRISLTRGYCHIPQDLGLILQQHRSLLHRRLALKLGRLDRTFNPRVPHLSAILASNKNLAVPPVQVDYSKGMPEDLGMMLNDKIGDCT